MISYCVKLDLYVQSDVGPSLCGFAVNGVPYLQTARPILTMCRMSVSPSDI